MVLDCSGFIQPLDIECLFVNLAAGSLDTFIMLALIGIALLGCYFKMLDKILGLIYCVFAVIMSQYLGGVFFFSVLIVGIIAAYIIGGLVKR